MSFLNERHGVSLSSIRKWILDKHPETKEKQKASFNSLTIKVFGDSSECAGHGVIQREERGSSVLLWFTLPDVEPFDPSLRISLHLSEF